MNAASRLDDLRRLTFIRRGRALGFSVAEVRTLLRLADERKRPCAEVRIVAFAHGRRKPGYWRK